MSDDLLHALSVPADIAAPRLLGCHLVRRVGSKLMSGRIVETEAYSQDDVASHSYRGQTPRTKVMFGPAGYLYVYFTYGMHYCCNVVTGPAGHGSAVLIRALEPLEGIEEQTRTDGPARLCKTLGIDKGLNGHDLRAEPLRLELLPLIPQEEIVQTTRIGISRAQDVPWRFYIKGNKYISKP